MQLCMFTGKYGIIRLVLMLLITRLSIYLRGVTDGTVAPGASYACRGGQCCNILTRTARQNIRQKKNDSQSSKASSLGDTFR